MNSRPVRLSVVIPTYQRQTILPKCLEALFRQTVPHDDYEILVSDDGSTDGTGAAFDETTRAAPVATSYLWAENAGGNAARNRAIARARGEIVLFLNDDSIATPGLIAHHLQAHADHPEASTAVLGRITISPDVAPSLFADLHLDATFIRFTDRQQLDWRGFITCNLSVKTNFLRTCGLFDERMRLPMHDDLELGLRLHPHALKVFYRADALCFHDHHLSERDFLRQADRDGRELAKWFQRSPQLLPELEKLGLLGREPLRREIRHRVADAVLNRHTFPAALRLAGTLAQPAPKAAQFVYTRLFQHLKRRAIDEVLHGPAAP